MQQDRLPFPIRGASDAGAFGDFDPNFAPPESLQNVRPYGSRSKRARGGRRAGMEEAFGIQLAGPVQAMAAFSKASTLTGTELGGETPFGDGTTQSLINYFWGGAHVRNRQGGIESVLSNTFYLGTLNSYPFGEGLLTSAAIYVSGIVGTWLDTYTFAAGTRVNSLQVVTTQAPITAKVGYVVGNLPSPTGKQFWQYEASTVDNPALRSVSQYDTPEEVSQAQLDSGSVSVILQRIDLLNAVVPVYRAGFSNYTDNDPGGDTTFPANGMVVADHWVFLLLKNGVLAVSKEMSTIQAEGPRPAQVWWYDCEGWSNETIAAVIREDLLQPPEELGGRRIKEGFILFQGSWQAGSWYTGEPLVTDQGAAFYPSEPILPFRWAGHWRSGIDRVFIDDRPPGELGGAKPITKAGFGDKIGEFDRYGEVGTLVPIAGSRHRTFRFSEHLERAPRGCWPEDMTLDSDGNLVVAMSNTGYGPNEAHENHLPNAAGWRPVTLAKINPGIRPWAGSVPDWPPGEVLWEVDTRSKLISAAGLPPVDGQDFDSDMPHDTGEDATLRAVATGPGGRVYCGGLRTGGNVFCLNPEGIEQWVNDVGDAVRQGAMMVDGSDGNVLVGSASNTSWVSSVFNPGNTVQAHAWRLDSVTGAVRQWFDLPNIARVNTYDLTPTFDQASPITSLFVASDGDILFGHWHHDGS